MIEALMYGVSPKAIIEKFANVPPENTSSKESSGLPEKSDCREVLSIPAAGIWAISLKIATIAAVINSFRLMSGERTILEKNCNKDTIIIIYSYIQLFHLLFLL